MYKVSNNLNSAYPAEFDPFAKKSEQEKSLEKTLPISSTTRKMIKQRKEEAAASAKPTKPTITELEKEGTGRLKPLRYDSNLVCDPHLESLRPKRETKHIPLPAEDEWKKKLIKKPATYEGSFADADMEKFRPEPNPPPETEDPWYVSRLPQGSAPSNPYPAYERLAGAHYDQDTNPYDQIYPQDELSQIKMRNRKFEKENLQHQQGQQPPQHHQSSMPMNHGYYNQQQQMMMMMQMQMNPMFNPYGMPMYNPMMGQQMVPPKHPFLQMPDSGEPDIMNELRMLDQELNTTRRVTRPFVPENPKLQRQRDVMEEPQMSISPRSRRRMLAKENCPASVDELPPPKPVLARQKELAPETMSLINVKPRREVGIADQIATRAILLGKNLPPISKPASKAGSTRPGSKHSSKLSTPKSNGSMFCNEI